MSTTKFIVFALIMMVAFAAVADKKPSESDMCLESSGDNCHHCKAGKNDFGENIVSDKD